MLDRHNCDGAVVGSAPRCAVHALRWIGNGVHRARPPAGRGIRARALASGSVDQRVSRYARPGVGNGLLYDGFWQSSLPVVCQILNSFGLRARLLHHFHQDFPRLSRVAYLPQECDAGTTPALLGLQAHMKTEAINGCHRCFR